MLDYLHGYVSLPDDYGTDRYFNRDDIRAINQIVESNLYDLNSMTGFVEKLRGKEILIKPNLVTVFHDLGTKQKEFPETTDPRVMDALICFLKKYSSIISIIESSGRGIPTRGAFHVAGYDRIAKFRHIQLVPLEEQPISRYFLPKAQVMKEAALPQILDRVVNGSAYYISLPKMKTNLYTSVTLGIKSGMGLLPYNLRQRNHNFALDQKLVDLLYLVQPDLTIIDGIVGGEGNCPAPVDIIDSRVIISSDHVLEADRVAARMMGFDPETIPLITLADKAGFAAKTTNLKGFADPICFKAADPTLTSKEFKEQFPTVRMYFGFSSIIDGASSNEQISTEILKRMELRCRGGCLASTRFAFDMIMREGVHIDKPLNIFIGDGVPTKDGHRYYYGDDGYAIANTEIKNLPNTLAVGSCSSLSHLSNKHIKGCMPYPNAVHVAIHKMIGENCHIVSFDNKHLIRLLFNTLQVCEKRKSLLRSGQYIDLPIQLDDSVKPIPEIFSQAANRDWIKADLRH